MRVAVCCKEVPVNISFESVSVTNGDIHFKDTNYYINEFDAYALETALFLKDTYEVETVALTLGPLRTQEVLYFALAKGIDRALRIDGETSRPDFIASALIPVLKEIEPQLVLVGVQSEDWMGAEIGGYLSQALSMGIAYAAIEICELDETHVRIRKEIGRGRRAELALKLPAILCVQSGIRPLCYLSMSKRRKARSNPIELWGKLSIEHARQLISSRGDYEVTEVSVPSKEGHAEMITGERSEKAEKLLEVINSAVR